jgi:putative oxidoreductase
MALRLALGGFFLYASLDKIANPAAFAKVVYQWQIFGPVPSNMVAVFLPWVEAVAGVLLVAGLWKRESALVIAVLLGVFIAAAAAVLARGIDVENCGCTSVSAAKSEKGFFHGVGTFLILRNLVMLGAAAVLIAVPTRSSTGPASS